MNPLKFVGGMILEIGAVIAVLAFLPAMGDRDAIYPTSSEPAANPNRVFFDATSELVVQSPESQRQPTTVWQSDLIPLPSEPQRRYVENSLDHSSQRVLDAATRVWNQGDRLLPPELRVQREAEVAPPAYSGGYVESQPRASHYTAPAPRFDGRY